MKKKYKLENWRRVFRDKWEDICHILYACTKEAKLEARKDMETFIESLLKEAIKKAREVFDLLKNDFSTTWDARGNIGKRYYSQDEIGTSFCVTVDFDTLNDNAVTIRNRDTMKQERVKISELDRALKDKLK